MEAIRAEEIDTTAGGQLGLKTHSEIINQTTAKPVLQNELRELFLKGFALDNRASEVKVLLEPGSARAITSAIFAQNLYSELALLGSAIVSFANPQTPLVSRYRDLLNSGPQTSQQFSPPITSFVSDLEANGFRESSVFYAFPDVRFPRLLINRADVSNINPLPMIKEALGLTDLQLSKIGLTEKQTSVAALDALAPGFVVLAHKHRIHRVVHDGWSVSRFVRDPGSSELVQELIYSDKASNGLRLVRNQLSLTVNADWVVEGKKTIPLVLSARELLEQNIQAEKQLANTTELFNKERLKSVARELLLRSQISDLQDYSLGLVRRLKAASDGAGVLRKQLEQTADKLEQQTVRNGRYIELMASLTKRARHFEHRLDQLSSRPLVKLSNAIALATSFSSQLFKRSKP